MPHPVPLELSGGVSCNTDRGCVFPLENDQGDPRAHGFLGSCLFSVLQPLYLHLLYAEHIESLWVLLQDMSAHFLLGSIRTVPCLVCLPLRANLR